MVNIELGFLATSSFLIQSQNRVSSANSLSSLFCLLTDAKNIRSEIYQLVRTALPILYFITSMFNSKKQYDVSIKCSISTQGSKPSDFPYRDYRYFRETHVLSECSGN